jgi:hypothetical protein
LRLLWTGRWRRTFPFALAFWLGWLSGRHLRATRWWLCGRCIHAFGFVFATAFAVGTALGSRSATFLPGWGHSRLLLLELLRFTARLIEIFARAAGTTWSRPNVLALEAFAFSFGLGDSLRSRTWRSRRRWPAKLLAASSFFGLGILWHDTRRCRHAWRRYR